MAAKKVEILRPKLYDADSKELEMGLQDVDAKLAEKLIAKGFAKAPEAKKQTKAPEA